jgi:hypothetical protein
MAQMSLGAVGVIDALGFKGIWQRHNPADVAATLQEGRRIADRMADEVLFPDALQHVLRPAGQLPTVSAVAFSDTFFFTVVVPEARDREATLAGAAGVVACGLSYIIRKTGLAPVPLVFRGVIATGDCIIDPEDQVFIGPAVDEAAELMDQADGAFTWLAPSAAELDYSGWTGHWHDLLVPYDVPLKGGRSVHTKVVNPFVHISHQANDFDQIRQNYRKAMFSNLPGVEIKRQNTEALFGRFEQLSRMHWERMERDSEARIEYHRRDEANKSNRHG